MFARTSKRDPRPVASSHWAGQGSQKSVHTTFVVFATDPLESARKYALG